MARLFSCGFEEQSVTAGLEFSSNGLNGGGISTATKRTGSASMQINVVASFSWFGHVFRSATSNNEAICRVYVNFSAFPTVGPTEIVGAWDSVGAAEEAWIQVTSTGVLQLMKPTSTQVGSNSSALSLNTWYMIEIDVSGGTGTAKLEGRLNGSVFATTSTQTISAFDAFYLGNPNSSSTMNLFYDDWAINDTTGSFQNTYPGTGQIVNLRPNAAGDNNAFATQTGGTAGAANNFTRVNEVTPNDATTFNGDVTTGHIDDFNIDDTPSSIGASDTINVVQVGIRYRASVASAESAFQARIKKAAAGTVSSSTAITPNATAFKSHANAKPFNPPLTLYNDPDGSAWAKATLDTTQIGYTISTGNTNRADISTVWLTVDSTPVAVSTVKQLSALGVG